MLRDLCVGVISRSSRILLAAYLQIPLPDALQALAYLRTHLAGKAVAVQRADASLAFSRLLSDVISWKYDVTHLSTSRSASKTDSPVTNTKISNTSADLRESLRGQKKISSTTPTHFIPYIIPTTFLAYSE